MITELRYSNTNTYLIKGLNGYILFDTGWAGTFPVFCRALGEAKISVQDIKYIIISHFHPDHMGIVQNIAEIGATIVVFDVQREYIHASDAIFAKDKNIEFKPISDKNIFIVPIASSRAFLHDAGIEGEVLYTPGHSDDSISLLMDEGSLFVGDLNPLYELEIHKGTDIYESWSQLMARNPVKIYYGHAKSTVIGDKFSSIEVDNKKEVFSLVKKIMKYIDKGKTLETIQKKTGADKSFIEDVTRMYLTHQNVGVQGILDRIEIKGK